MAWFLSNILCENLRSLQAQAGASLEESSLAGAPSAQSKSSLTVVKFSCGGRTKATLNLSPSGMTCERLTDAHGMGSWMSLVAASPVRTLLREAQRKQGFTESVADSGTKWRASLAKYDPVSRSWKTRQRSFLEDSTEYAETWPRWGTVADGECLPLPTLARPTNESGYFLLPTVTKCWSERGPGLSNNMENLRMSRGSTELTLDLIEVLGWRWPLSFIEWMMGFPLGWTRLQELATHKFQSWLQQHGAF